MTREELVQLLLVERKTIFQVAQKLDVHRNTISNWMKKWDIDITDWWKYQTLTCNECGQEIDPKIELPMNKRKAMIKKPKNVCETCRADIARIKNREKGRRFRNKNRKHYNNYMKEYREKQKLKDQKD